MYEATFDRRKFEWQGDLLNAIAWYGLEEIGIPVESFAADGMSLVVRLNGRTIRITFEDITATPPIPAEASC